MAVISELIRTEENGKLSFGDYTLAAKAKLDNFEKDGDIYKVKTFKEITKLERNGLFVHLLWRDLRMLRLLLALKRRRSTKLI